MSWTCPMISDLHIKLPGNLTDDSVILDTVQLPVKKHIFLDVSSDDLYSALDKLWVNCVFTQPGYPQLRTCKNNCVFSKNFTPRFFFCDYTFSNCMKPSGMCLHIYSHSSSAFLKYQTNRFYCT